MSASEDFAIRYRDVRVLVLGAGGFIGANLAQRLAQAGARLTRVTRSANAGCGADVMRADLLASGELEALVRECAPAIVFNLAGYGVDPSERDEDLAQRTNADLVARLTDVVCDVEAGSWSGQRIVHVGSALEYGEVAGTLDEDTPVRPTTLYGRTKLAGTRALAERCRERGLRGLTARLFMIYGSGEHPGRLLPALIEAARSGQGIDLTAGLQQRDFTHVDDVCEGLLRLGICEADEGEVVNLATGRLTRVRDFVECAAEQLGMASDQLRFGALPTRGHEMSHDPVATGRLRKRTGWTPTLSIEEGIRRTLLVLRQRERGTS